MLLKNFFASFFFNWSKKKLAHISLLLKHLSLASALLRPSDPTAGTIPEGTQNINSKNISTLMFIAALFIITKIWKQPKCPSVDEWIKQLWDITQWNTTQL